VPAAWDAEKELVVPIEEQRLDRPYCPACIALVGKLMAPLLKDPVR
jgi:hypothetical protein